MVIRVKRVGASVRNLLLTQVALWGLVLCVVSMISGVKASMQQPTKETPPPPAEHQATAKQPTPTLAEGPGKDQLLRTCSKCHSPNQVMANGHDRQGWEDEITKMVGLGAVGTDAEFTDVLEYLVKNYPAQASSKVNVNKATASELETGLALSTKEAEAMVAYREKNGSYKSLDDLKKVPEIDAKKLDEKKDRLIF